MSFKDLELQRVYSSKENNLLEDFYIPVLKESIEYKRLSGYFTSNSLAFAARGLIGLIKNSGNMKLIVSPRLTSRDLEIIRDAKINKEKYVSDLMIEEIEKGVSSDNKLNFKLLGWMVANEYLDIKIALLEDDDGNLIENSSISLFHQKVGILKDKDNNYLGFSGSINETGNGWIKNLEEFKVFKGWDEAQAHFIKPDNRRFEQLWEQSYEGVRVVDVFNEVVDKFKNISAESFDDLVEEYELMRESRSKAKNNIELYEHQKEAVKKWVKNDYRGILKMATGTGKTFTAFGCYQALKEKVDDKLVTIVSTPMNHLTKQWVNEAEAFGVNVDYVVADSTNNYKNILYKKLYEIDIGLRSELWIFTTHSSLISKNLKKILTEFENDLEFFFIGDEVHGLGSEKRIKGLRNFFSYRLGLSATPERWFDEAGTKKILDYFNGVVEEFGLYDAINTTNPREGWSYLTPYKYKPLFTELDYFELQKYKALTAQIVKLYNIYDDEDTTSLRLKIFERANIVKNAQNKFDALEKLMAKLKHQKGILIYCTSKQIDKILNILNKHNISRHTFTMEENTAPEDKYNGKSEREVILDYFSKGDYQVLVAIKCLDEGIDIPQAKTAIFMASGGNPREYIQRIGRVIRRHITKDVAIIYDIIIKPSTDLLSPEMRDVERKIYEKQVERCKDIAKIAINSHEALSKINTLL